MTPPDHAPRDPRSTDPGTTPLRDRPDDRSPPVAPVGTMSSDPCDGCGRDVSVAGGIANLWTFDADTTGGVTLELADGTEHFLCFDCIERLPDDREVTAADVAALSE